MKHSSKRIRQSRNAKARRGRLLAGAGGTAAAFLAFGMSPLGSAPPARADGLDLLIEPIIGALSSVDPTLGVDLTGWLTNLDSALDSASTFAASSLTTSLPNVDSALSAASSVDPSSAAGSSTDLAQLYDQFFYEPVHTFDQQWIDGTSIFGPGTVQFNDFHQFT